MNAATKTASKTNTQREKAKAIYDEVKTSIGTDSPDFRQSVISKITKKLGVQPATASVYYYYAKDEDGNPTTTRARRASQSGERKTGNATKTARKRTNGDEGNSEAGAGARGRAVANSAMSVKLFVAERGDDKAFFLSEEAADSYAARRSGTEVRKARKADFR